LRRTSPRGFTLIEVMVVVAIIAITSAIAFDSMRRSKPRANFQSTAAEIQSLVHQARQEALASGVQVAVMVFPDYANDTSTGRIIVLRDAPNEAFFTSTSTSVTFASYQAGTLASPTDSHGNVGKVVATLDLPRDVLIGPSAFSLGSLAEPYASITIGKECTFCAEDGDRRGAIVFDARGRTSFYAGTAMKPTRGIETSGQGLTIYSTELGAASTYSTSTLVITSPMGTLRTIQNG
jgi:prepilin-type N-terminal cleavage/methylation domain-containing protein